MSLALSAPIKQPQIDADRSYRQYAMFFSRVSGSD